MRATGLALITAVMALAAGCSVSTTENSITLKTQKKYIGPEESRTASADYAGEEINVGNANGDLIVESDSSTTKIVATMKPVAYADDDAHKSDAEANQAQVIDSFKLTEESGKITITCGQGRGVNTSKRETSGCENLRVRVPAGKGIKLVAIANNGSVNANGLAAAEGASLRIKSENGSVNATVTGGAEISSDNGDVTVSSTPTKGSTVAIETGNGDINLSLPSDFSADSISFSAGDGIKIEGFSDLTDKSTSRGTAGTGAKAISAKASSLGTLTVKSR
jgi:hypothetical protein